MPLGLLIFLAIIVALLIICLLITAHEFAHFVIAKASGAYVYEFSIGIGPKIWQWGKKETKYTLRWIPLGGYVMVASETVDPPKGREAEIVKPEQKLENIKRSKRFGFIIAGSIMNLLIAMVIFSYSFAIAGYKPSDMSYWGAKYAENGVLYNAFKQNGEEEINQNLVVFEYWLSSNKEELDKIKANPNFTADDIIKVNLGDQNNIPTYKKTVYSFIDNLKKEYQQNKDDDKTGYIVVKYAPVDPNKNVGEFKITAPQELTANEDSKTYSVGIAAPDRIFTSWIKGYFYGWKEAFEQSFALLQGFGNLLTGNVKSISGPVGMAKQTAMIIQSGGMVFLSYVGMISANLFMLNLLPIPPLDGHKFVENAVEGGVNFIRKRKYMRNLKKSSHDSASKSIGEFKEWEFSQKSKIIVNVIGVCFFLLLIIGITIKDIIF